MPADQEQAQIMAGSLLWSSAAALTAAIRKV
jgi:hypothetical protein